ncbi:alpha-glucosidase [Amycolatopsis arida]|uniref:Alpha-glucosidase n=1 Tax=Amycolatopsis arida TaxID=587909 RepID=A0A1I5ULV2_9PSEU|nr:DUF3459 domain-containing protein [Amycolatopsis arida]TDX90945.1 alpha-glucosidase [Amycolatopsis arida]SFP96200.1 alpha-glucosidase [Amycolatopsis arida]
MRRAVARSDSDRAWWTDAVCYVVHVPSFADADGDGVGDLAGVRSRLGYLELLGVDALTLALPEPAGRHPTDDVDGLVSDAHRCGLKVTVDVPLGDDPAELEHILRSWLAHGVDGFRVGGDPAGGGDPTEAHRTVRKVLDEHPAVMAAGRWSAAGPLDLVVDRGLVLPRFDADALQAAVERALTAAERAGVPPAWTAVDHRGPRQADRFGAGEDGPRRARAMALFALALPGAVFLDQGEELGLAGAEAGVPLPWEGAEPPFAFSTAPRTWPVPGDWADRTVAAQLEDTDSTLSLYRRALELRQEHPAVAGSTVEWYGAPPGCCALRRQPGGLVCAVNSAAAPVPLPPGEVLLSSVPLAGEQLAPDAAAWLV